MKKSITSMKIRTRLKRKKPSTVNKKRGLNKPCSLALRVTAAVIVMLLPADMSADWVAEGVTPSLTTQMPLLHNSARLSICGCGLFVVYSLLEFVIVLSYVPVVVFYLLSTFYLFLFPFHYLNVY